MQGEFMLNLAGLVGAPSALELPGAVLRRALELIMKQESLVVYSGINRNRDGIVNWSAEVGPENPVWLERGARKPEGHVVTFRDAGESLLAYKELRRLYR